MLIDEAEKAGHKLYIETIGDDVDAFQSYQNALMLRYNQGNMEILSHEHMMMQVILTVRLILVVWVVQVLLVLPNHWWMHSL